MSHETLDALTLELVLTRVISAADEAAEALKRSSFSTLVTESNDLAIVVTDTGGRLIGQSTESIPAFIGTLPITVKHVLSVFGDDLKEGDLIATNDPWTGSGHLNDISLVRPVFRGGRLTCIAASCAHAPDIGGRGRSLESRELYEEGFMIPPLKILRGGVVDETFFALYRENSRTPGESEGDVWAGINALASVERRIGRILDDYGLDDLDAVAREINRRSELAMRKAISAVPDGVYRHRLLTDGFEVPLSLEVAVTVAGDRIGVDFTGSSAAVPRAINCPITYTFAMTAYALKSLLLPDLPNCEGPLSCLNVAAPVGSIVNPIRPSAVAGRVAVGQYLPPLIFAALAPVLPERVMAMPGSPLWSCVLNYRSSEGRPATATLFFNGGMGATAHNDGEPCYSWPSNVSNVPVEIVEARSPLRINYKRLVPGSGGRGRRRGGLGQEISMTALDDAVTVKLLAERCRQPAEGLLGAGDGQVGAVRINGVEIDVRVDHLLHAGDELSIRTPGGGGLGPVSERAAIDVERDRMMGYVPPSNAEDRT
ncbi:MAG: hydantoinase B/oxoprolinase family protein [Hyphomicrobiaceae bacterium]